MSAIHPADEIARSMVQCVSRLLLYCTLSLLSSTAGFAYEKDIHYSATLAIAIAAGWPQDEALVIASADQGVDENKTTVAALEVDVVEIRPEMRHGEPFYARGPIHQAQKNFYLHCFSEVDDQRGQVQSGVGKAISDRVQAANRALEDDAQAPTPQQSWVNSLVAIGVALHCIQDSYSHNGYGGLCPKNGKANYPGNCYGHTKDSAKDRYPSLFGGRTNPDHPAVRDIGDLARALHDTLGFLQYIRLQMGPHARRPPSAGGAMAGNANTDRLAQWLHNPNTKQLKDPERIECNHEVAATWLATVLPGEGAGLGMKRATTPVSKACADALPRGFPSHRLALQFLQPPYPKLAPDARAAPEGANDYAKVDTNAADLKVEEISHKQHSCDKSGCTYSFSVRISNLTSVWSAAGYLLIAVVPMDDVHQPFGIKAPFDSVAGGASAVVTANTKAPGEKEYVVYADVQPPPGGLSDWKDKDVSNDSATCIIRDGKAPLKQDEQKDVPPCRSLDK